MVNPSMSASPDIGGVNAEYSNNTARQYDESLSQEIAETKNALEVEKNTLEANMQNISQVVYNSVNNENLTESGYQFSNEDVYDNTDFSDKTDTYVNMNTSYRYIKFNVDGAGDFYNQLGEWSDFQKDSPKKVFTNLKNRFVELGFNKKFENGQRKTVEMNSDKDFLYVIWLFQAVVENNVDWASKKDFRVWPNTLKSLAKNIKFETEKQETWAEISEVKNDVVWTRLNELQTELIKHGNDFFDLDVAEYDVLQKDLESKIVEINILLETIGEDWNSTEVERIKKMDENYRVVLDAVIAARWSKVESTNNTIPNLSHKYLWELFKLDDDVEKSEFKQQWKRFELWLPKFSSTEEKDNFYTSIYYGLYDLRNKFTNPKVKKEITSLMEEYDPLFDKYENFYIVWDKIVEKLFDEWIFKHDLELIEDFFNKEWAKETADSGSRGDTVSWSLLTEDTEDGTPWQRTRIVSAMKKIIDEWKISDKELSDFKAVMFQTRDVFSHTLDDLNLDEKKGSVNDSDSTVVEKDSSLDIEAQRSFEQPMLDNVKKIRKETAESKNKNKK